MVEMGERLCCPACGPSPALADIGAGLGVDGLYRCAECRGVLAGHRALEQARRHVAPAHPALQVRNSPHRCRRCHQRAEPSATRCAGCSASLVLACPRCRASMATLEVLGIVVDVCRACELTFFDAGEFAHASSSPAAFVRALQVPVGLAPSARGSVAGGSVASDSVASGSVAGEVIEVVALTPEAIEPVVHVARAVGHVSMEAASHVVRAAGSVDAVVITRTAGKAALGGARIAAEAAGDAGESILEVLASLFDGL